MIRLDISPVERVLYMQQRSSPRINRKLIYGFISYLVATTCSIWVERLYLLLRGYYLPKFPYE